MSKSAIIFPGQGAQVVGMGKDLAEAFPECRAIFDKANAVLGFDLAKLCFDGPIEELTKSSNAQPAIFAASVTCHAGLKKLKPDASFSATAGLSSGEWTALYLAGVVSFEDTLRVLQVRGQYMQEACVEQPGAMLSVIGLDVEKLRSICEQAGVEMANMNSPEQTVLSGRREKIDVAELLVKEAGAKRGIRLNVAGAFHSSLMATAARRLEGFLSKIAFSAPKMPVISNVTGQPHTSPDEIRQLMVKQVTSSVQWVSCVRTMAAQGVKAYVECGPGKVLTGLIKRIDNQAVLHNIADRPSLEAAANAWTN